MAKRFEEVIKGSLDAYTKIRHTLVKRLANEAINHFKDSFRKQGFEDESIKKWKQRKIRKSKRIK